MSRTSCLSFFRHHQGIKCIEITVEKLDVTYRTQLSGAFWVHFGYTLGTLLGTLWVHFGYACTLDCVATVLDAYTLTSQFLDIFAK